MDLIKRDYYISLFEVYESLLTDKQKEYFMSYYYEDLSLQEIASNFDVSRNAIFDQIKKVEANLDMYEENLHLYAIKREIIDNLEDSTVKERLLKLLKEE